jgi:hypothetical protein
MGNGMGSEGSSGLGQGGFGAPGAGGSSGGGQGGILGQDPNGPLGAIISDIESRMDKLGDAQRAKAEAEKQSNTGTAKIATGAVFTGAGIAIAGKTGNYVGEAAAVLVVVIGLGLVVSGVFDKVQGEKDKAAADKVIADEQEKEREAAKKKMPPDLLRPSSYLLQVLALRTGDVFATGGGQASGATAAAAGVSPVVSKLLTGDGLAALFVTDDKGHVRLPVALPGAG